MCFPSWKHLDSMFLQICAIFETASLCTSAALLEKWNVSVYKLEALSFHITLVHVGFWTSIGWRMGDVNVLLYPKYFVYNTSYIIVSNQNGENKPHLKMEPAVNIGSTNQRNWSKTRPFWSACDKVWSYTRVETKLLHRSSIAAASVGLGVVCHLTQGAHFRMNANVALLLLHISICSMSVCFYLYIFYIYIYFYLW